MMMGPAFNHQLLPDTRQSLVYLSGVISEFLSRWNQDEEAEMECGLQDDYNYLSISAATRAGDDRPTIQIEFGVQDDKNRRATGALVSGWSTRDMCIKELEIVLIEGKPCDISQFAAHLSFLLYVFPDKSEWVGN